MRREIQFEKDLYGWYAVLPEWTGPRDELEMVAGADNWLDILCQGEWDVWMTISDEPFDGAEKLEFISMGLIEGFEYGRGAWYVAREYMGLDFSLKMWLCDVTTFVFGDYPKIIYYKV
jgi:hypothetical protein